MDCLSNLQIQIVIPLLLSTFLGAFIGLEREYKGKEAGIQTYSLVSLGACLFTIASFELFNKTLLKTGLSFDPSRVIQAIAIGIGFIGAGVIFRQEISIKGLTTAAGLWVTAAVGIVVGAGLYLLASFATFLIILIFAGFGALEWKLFEKSKR